MKKSFKKQILTGVAAASLIFPVVLGGLNQANAAQTMTPRAANVGTTATMQPSARQTGATMPANASQTGQNAPANAQQTGQNAPAQQNGQSNNQQPKNLTPQQKAAQAQQKKQIIAKLMAMQKKQQAEELKKSTPMFVVQGNEVYSMRVIIGKNGSATPIPSTKKKYTSVKRFQKIDRRNLKKGISMMRQAKQISSKKARNIQMNQAKALILKYERVGRLPTQKQEKAQQKAAAKQAKSNKGRRTTKRSHKRTRRSKRARRTRRNHKRTRKTKRNRIARRINKHRRNARSKKNTFTLSFTYLKSKYHQGSNNRAKRSGFAEGPDLGGINTMFNRYKPNDRRAVIPKSYQIKPNDTTWLVGRYTNNTNKINHMRNVYYYNGQTHGWANIGYKK